MLGITPQLGYSLTNWLDAGITFNLNYLSQRDYYSGDKLRQTTYGPGAFVRLFPVNFLFATAQYEYNSMHLKYIPNVPGSPSQTSKLSANSFLVGAGYAGGRMREEILTIIYRFCGMFPEIQIHHTAINMAMLARLFVPDIISGYFRIVTKQVDIGKKKRILYKQKSCLKVRLLYPIFRCFFTIRLYSKEYFFSFNFFIYLPILFDLRRFYPVKDY